MGEIVFVGLGLYDDKGISLQGIEEAKTADKVFIELYTSLMPAFSMERFEKTTGRKLHVISRKTLEEENGQIIIEAAKKGKAVLLVPGDPLIATTHITLRIQAKKLGIPTRLVHGASIISAAIGLSGLHSYKFGKSVTIPFPSEIFSETPYRVIVENKKAGLHTLCLLDIKADEKCYLTIREGLKILLKIESKTSEKVVKDSLAVGIARAGSPFPTVKADFVEKLVDYNFGEPPHTIIFPSDLHFMEAEALIVLADAPEKLRGMVK